MKTLVRWLTALAVGLLAIGAQVARAADPIPTTVSLSDMLCEGCAQKVTAKLLGLRGVVTVAPGNPAAPGALPGNLLPARLSAPQSALD